MTFMCGMCGETVLFENKQDCRKHIEENHFIKEILDWMCEIEK